MLWPHAFFTLTCTPPARRLSDNGSGRSPRMSQGPGVSLIIRVLRDRLGEVGERVATGAKEAASAHSPASDR